MFVLIASASASSAKRRHSISFSKEMVAKRISVATTKHTGDQMNIAILQLIHDKCGKEGTPCRIAISEKHQLLVQTFCQECHEIFTCGWDLTVIYKQCPKPDQEFRAALKPPLALPESAPEFKLTPNDVFFEHGLGVKSDEEDFGGIQ